GGGASLQRQRPDDFGNDPVNWKGEGPTPGRANVPGSSYADADGDGISDAWEIAHGLNRLDPGDAAQDSDGDGRSNYAEFLDGTEPQNASSRLTPPSITVDPQNQIALPGSNVTFSVAAGRSPPFPYQWRFNGQDIPGEINSTLNLLGVQPTDAGGYSALVVNAAGFATSRTANLVINIPPMIT